MSQANIFWEAVKQQDLAFVKKVLCHEVDVNKPDKSGITPLMLAAEKDNLDILTELLEAGANLNAQNEAGDTATMIAAFECNYLVMSHLILAGADPSVKNKDGKSLLDIVCGSDLLCQALSDDSFFDSRKADGLTSVEIISKAAFLLGVDNPDIIDDSNIVYNPNTQEEENTGYTLLMLAIMSGYEWIVSELLNLGADVYGENYRGENALDLAAIQGGNIAKIVDSHAKRLAERTCYSVDVSFM